jgi:hypothetical protein
LGVDVERAIPQNEAVGRGNLKVAAAQIAFYATDPLDGVSVAV